MRDIPGEIDLLIKDRMQLIADLFRFGASSLLSDIERQLEHHLTGHYSASNRHAMG
jgi:deoxyribose-phosphate aldolase